MTFRICKWLFLLLVVSLPLVRPFNAVLFGLQVPFTDFIFLGAFAFWLISLIRRETVFEFSKFYLFIAFYGVALTISTIFSTQPQRSFFKLGGEFYLFALAVLTFNLIRDGDFFKRILFAWLAGTTLTVAASAAGFILFYIGYKTPGENYLLSHFGSLPAGNYPRLHALFANANMMANYLNVSLMLAALAERNGWLKKIWARFLQTGIWAAAVFTFSPGLGGMFLSLGIWYWALCREKRSANLSRGSMAAAIALAVLVFASTLISPDTQNTAREFPFSFAEKKFEPSVRVLVWENAFQIFKEYPFAGNGTGTNTATLQYRTLSGSSQILLDAHNVWLNVAAQSGLLGLAAFVLLIIYLTKKLRFDFERLDEPRTIRLALSCAFAGAFLYQGLSGSFEDARHLWILFGMLAGTATFSKNDT